MRKGEIVEAGHSDEIYESPRSEYTRSLLAAAPVLDADESRRLRAERKENRAVQASA
uniref:ABC transporter ATP-binding protein n=1 Tax=Nocardiopsis xinjiangensis TaxID=124285 RepID=UPI0003489F53